LLVVRRRHACSRLFPSTTLFRSLHGEGRRIAREGARYDRERSDDDEQEAEPSHHHSSFETLTGVLHPPASRRRSDGATARPLARSEEHTSELQSRGHLVCRLLLE